MESEGDERQSLCVKWSQFRSLRLPSFFSAYEPLRPRAMVVEPRKSPYVMSMV